MGTKPKPVPLHSRLWALVRRNPIKTAAAVLGILGAYPGGVAGAKLVSNQVEPAWYASHEWVREHVDTKLSPIVTAQTGDRNILRDLQIDQVNRSIRDESNNRAKWAIEKSKTKDPVTIELIERQLRTSQDSVDALDKQLDTLRKLKAQGQ